MTSRRPYIAVDNLPDSRGGPEDAYLESLEQERDDTAAEALRRLCLWLLLKGRKSDGERLITREIQMWEMRQLGASWEKIERTLSTTRRTAKKVCAEIEKILDNWTE